jgi:hypothetical protein
MSKVTPLAVVDASTTNIKSLSVTPLTLVGMELKVTLDAALVSVVVAKGM